MALGGGGGHVDPAAAGSTALFFQDFFPAAQHHLAHRHPVLYGLMQPAWLAEACPEHRLLLGPLALRNPALLPVQLAGAAVGLWGVRRLLRPHQAYLRHSLLFFLCMNASSIVCHTLTARGTRLWGVAAAADVAFTGASSLCLAAFQAMRPPQRSADATAARRASWTVLAATLSAAAANLRFPTPWLPEAVYLGTTLAATALTAQRLASGFAAAPSMVAQHALAALGAALMALCLPLDPLLCWLGGPWLGTTPLLFLGSTLGFAGIVALADGGAMRAAGGSVRDPTKAE